jgi:hypothetical protein
MNKKRKEPLVILNITFKGISSSWRVTVNVLFKMEHAKELLKVT